MPKDLPYMPFFTQAWFGDDKVSLLSYEEQGVYITLLARMWESPTGTLPDDDRYLAKLLRISPKKWRSLRSVLIDGQFAVMQTDGTIIFQDRLLREWRKAKEIQAKRAQAGALGAQQKLSKRQANAVAHGAANPEHPDSTRHGDATDLKQQQQQPGPGLASPAEPLMEQATPAPAIQVSESPGGASETAASPPDGVDVPEDLSNLAIIRTLTAEYRAVVDAAWHRPTDWAIMGDLYRRYGALAVSEGIRALSTALGRGRTIRDPTAYVSRVARSDSHARVRDAPDPAGEANALTAWFGLQPGTILTQLAAWAKEEDEPP